MERVRSGTGAENASEEAVELLSVGLGRLYAA